MSISRRDLFKMAGAAAAVAAVPAVAASPVAAPVLEAPHTIGMSFTGKGRAAIIVQWMEDGINRRAEFDLPEDGSEVQIPWPEGAMIWPELRGDAAGIVEIGSGYIDL